jgi:hypothetical protein
VRWVNYFGDPGILKIGPFKSNVDSKGKFEIDLDIISEDQTLKLEEPKSIMFRLYNLSPNPMKITLSVKERDVGDLLICGISKYVIIIIYNIFVESGKIRSLIVCRFQFRFIPKELWCTSC